MNVLFVLYGDLEGNSAVPLMLHARELHARGHRCAVAVVSKEGAAAAPPTLRVMSHEEALADPLAVFDGEKADVLHAWTPRENVRRFVTAWLVARPTPWVIYLEDNEEWIAKAALAMVGLREDVLLQHSQEVISTWTPPGLPHVLRFRAFIGLADAAAVIQPKLAADVPPWVPCTTVMPGVDLEAFAPRAADPALRARYGVRDGEKVVVYPGGLNDFTRPGLEALARAVGLVNERGVPCRLLRSGPVALDFLERLPAATAQQVTDLGALPRAELPGLMALADAFVQPGQHDAFEDLRLPGKLPELFAMGRPVAMPRTNIAGLLEDGVNVVFHDGTPESIAERCLDLFRDPQRAQAIGAKARAFAEAHFDPRVQAARLEGVHEAAIAAFDADIARATWTPDAAQRSVSALLARRLRLLADAGGAPAASVPALLRAHAAALDFMLARSYALQEGMAVRDRELDTLRPRIALDAQVKELQARVAAMEGSLSWRLTRPIRMALDLLAGTRGRPRS
ncbi:MAG TPA: glycosyltransferase family 4 protein [Usitatibacter sp.]|nr:glycosyltransferase family 4 protein [Usitatibacter sp.]